MFQPVQVCVECLQDQRCSFRHDKKLGWGMCSTVSCQDGRSLSSISCRKVFSLLGVGCVIEKSAAGRRNSPLI